MKFNSSDSLFNGVPRFCNCLPGHGRHRNMLVSTMFLLTSNGHLRQVPLLNAIDSLVTFCIVLMVTTSTLYLNKIDTRKVSRMRKVTGFRRSEQPFRIGLKMLISFENSWLLNRHFSHSKFFQLFLLLGRTG